MRDKILDLLENDSRLLPADLAVRLGLTEADVAAEIEAMIDEQVICGFSALVDWDKTDKNFVTALIEVRVTPRRDRGFDELAERVYRFDEVKAVYLMSGGFDLTVIIEGRTIKDVAFFVSEKLSTIDGVLSTDTHFVLKKYKDHGRIFVEKNKPDDRLIVS